MDNTLKSNTLVSQVAAPDKTSNKTSGYADSNNTESNNDQDNYQSVARNLAKSEGKTQSETGNKLPSKASNTSGVKQTESSSDSVNDHSKLATTTEQNIVAEVNDAKTLALLEQTTEEQDVNKIVTEDVKSGTSEQIDIDDDAVQNMLPVSQMQSRIQLVATDSPMSLSQYVHEQYNKGTIGFHSSNQNNIALDKVVIDNDLAQAAIKDNVGAEQLNIDKNIINQELDVNKFSLEGEIDGAELKSNLTNAALQDLTLETDSMSQQMKSAIEAFGQGLKNTQNSSVQSQAALPNGLALTGNTTASTKLDIISHNGGEIQDNTPRSTVNGIPDKIHMMLSKQDQSMRIMLEPPELGAMEIKINNNNGSTHISFHTQVSGTKDVIESQMQDLKQMLEQQGIDLGDVNVYHQDANQQNPEDPETTYTARFDDAEKEDVEVHQLQYRTNSRLDLFA